MCLLYRSIDDVVKISQKIICVTYDEAFLKYLTTTTAASASSSNLELCHKKENIKVPPKPPKPHQPPLICKSFVNPNYIYLNCDIF